MAEYIERAAVLALLKDDREVCTYSKVELKYIRADIRYLPAADVRPVVKAYWIGEGDGYADGEMVYDVWHCSNCDYTVDEGDNAPPQYNFCPNCGADMREVDDAL